MLVWSFLILTTILQFIYNTNTAIIINSSLTTAAATTNADLVESTMPLLFATCRVSFHTTTKAVWGVVCWENNILLRVSLIKSPRSFVAWWRWPSASIMRW